MPSFNAHYAMPSKSHNLATILSNEHLMKNKEKKSKHLILHL